MSGKYYLINASNGDNTVSGPYDSLEEAESDMVNNGIENSIEGDELDLLEYKITYKLKAKKILEFSSFTRTSK